MEICDGKDNNCDGEVDEEGEFVFFEDADGDGWGNPGTTINACSAHEGWVEQSGDCNDSDASVHPGSIEVCDGKDNNCDGQVDEIGDVIFFEDADSDGWGNLSATVKACSAPAGYEAQGGDCDDGDETVYPGAMEICDGKDNNCDGQVDEGC
jgi:large repetitive protein